MPFSVILSVIGVFVYLNIIVKGLGLARRIDEAFQLLESVEQGIAVGNPKLSAPLIYGLLDALIEAGQC